MFRRTFLALFLAAGMTAPAAAEDRAVIDSRVAIAEKRLYSEVSGARELASRARGVLIMPEVVKGGFIVGGAYGEGALRVGGRTVGYYSVAAASVGFQAGIQKTSHALFFMTDGALASFRRSDGWEVGADAEVTFPEKGFNIGTDSTRLQKPIIAVVFAQDGLLAGASLEGSKYSPIQR